MDYLIALAPSLGVGLLFVVIMRALIRADRRERSHDAKVREEIAEKLRNEVKNN